MDMTALTATAEDILKIKPDHPEKLFTYNNYVAEARALRKKWHPDTCKHKDADAVTARINVLLQEAEHKISNNTWSENASFKFSANGTKFQMKYKKHHEFELGDMYIGDSKVIYVIKEDYKKLAGNSIKVISSFKYANDAMKKEFERFLPVKTTHYAADCGNVIAVDKTKDLLLLQDVLNYYDDHKMPKKQAMWVTSSLYNIACFLEYNKISHNAISPMNVFISPQYHSVALLGGWWYARKHGEKLLGVPGHLINIFPKDILAAKTADTKCDRLLIKGTTMACLGDDTMNGSKLLSAAELPKGLVHWLRQPSSKNAITEYKEWMEVLIAELGPRKFIPYELTVDDIY